MIHQMMMLLHLEMQLRQQALISYSQATDPIARLQRLDEVRETEYTCTSHTTPASPDGEIGARNSPLFFSYLPI